MARSTMLHGKGRVIGAGGIAVFAVIDFFEGTSISWIVRNECPGEMKIIQQHPIGFDGIERRIPQKGIRVKSGSREKKSESTGFKEVASPMDLSSSGEPDFFSAAISGWAALKLLSQKAIWRIMPRPLVRMANLSA